MMTKVIGGKKFTFVLVALVIVIFFLGIFLSTRYFFNFVNTHEYSVMIDGEYSVDGGEWKKYDPTKVIDEHFHKIVFRGKPVKNSLPYIYMAISSQNVWYTLRTDEEVLLDYHFKDYNYQMDNPAPSMYMSNTPGFNIALHDLTYYPEEVTNGTKDLILEVEYPYAAETKSFSDCFSVSIGTLNSLYPLFFSKAFPAVLLFVLVCFFGMFFFPISGFILGKINYRYLVFGLLCFFWGLYMITQSARIYLNLWILDPTICTMIDQLTWYLFIASIFLYLKSNMQRELTRVVANITSAVFLIAVIVSVILHLTNTLDMVATEPNMFIIITICGATLFAMLCIETKKNNRALVFIISWIPLMIASAIDVLDYFFDIPGTDFFNYGLAITMIYQIVRLILDLRTQYKEAIRYQQIQKELYEAKVSMMVSQIQPHFMYNALSSIAMMCTIEPETAQEATITFAKYLRTNMDSLKNTAPVPFEKELEHLKKYLYIEKLRFGDKLNIEYDIQASDFVVPQLSIQPLVENAVKHGVGMKKNGGTVKISTVETDDSYVIVISDDGVGFDTTKDIKDDSHSHVGIDNTRRRINELCKGEVIIESTVGKGTTAKIILPKEDTAGENSMS